MGPDVYAHGLPVRWAGDSRSATSFFPVPEGGADPLLMRSNQVVSFAMLDHRLRRGRVFGIREHDLLRHMYILGKTGTGKTVLLERLLLTIIRRGGGCAILDPHGDLSERLLDFIPRSRTNDVVLFDPADLAHPIGMNLLESVPPDRRPLVATGVLGVFRKLFADFWGPRMEHVFRNTLLALLDVRGATLLGVPRMLVEERYREQVIRQVRDPLVRFFWTREFPSYPKPFLAEVVAPVQNKVMALLSSPVVRNIVGQHRSTIVPRAIMDERRILIANLSKGRIGEDASQLLGAALVTKFQLAAYARADIPENAREPFTLVIDEFSSFVTRSFMEIVAEARKYALALVVAHQYLGQIDEDLRAAMLGNVGTLVLFRIGAEDARIVGREFEPEFEPEDLTRLSAHQLAIRLSVDGLTTAPFTAETLPPFGDDAREGHAALIRRVSQERYGRPVRRVEEAVGRQMGG